MANETGSRPSKNERRNQAREQARIAREQEKKREKRNRLFIQGGIVLGVLAILAIIGLVLTQTMKPAGPGPKNMASGGVVFTKDLKVVEGPALKADGQRKAVSTDREKLPLDVTVYVDYMCPACGAFEQQYGTMLENYVGSGDVNLQVYPLNFLDSSSLGTKYSTRAGNMFACVVEEQPDVAFKLHNLLLSKEEQPQENTPGLTDDQLLDVAKKAGADVNTELKQCVKDVRFGSFIAANYKSVSEVGIKGLAKDAQVVGDPTTGELQKAGEPQRLRSTPTVIVNGQQWVSNRDGDLEAYLLKVKGEIEQKAGAEQGAGDTKKSQ
ncbi:thioredoxin domain-containing protein [Leucobacter sp. CSA2]|uniref:Thioredoxin domain-containing protein n=1 Tax=Leucobacter edaphi TaxID=2796472 RepID=A0A934QEK1_9MICO|nr:thioredoxin domain-containing protein [Leucobacter edaphi]MBK0422410.1 thioredoxin domain-containing protein [Leucobacter edaphi]